MTSTRRRRTGIALAAALALVLSAPLAIGASERWFHVHVDDRSSGGAEVTVNLPLSVIESAARLVPDEVNRDLSRELRVELNDAGFTLDELRTLWSEIRVGDDATYVTVRDDDHDFDVRKAGDFLIVESTESSATQINVRFPLPVVDALLSGPADRLDLAGAIRQLAEYDDGNMVTVRDGDTTVRVWIDSSNTQ